MCPSRSLFVLALVLFAWACSEPKCPSGYMQYGNVCRRCKPGEEREHGRCVPVWDAEAEPIVDDNGGQEADSEDAEVEPAADSDEQDSGAPSIEEGMESGEPGADAVPLCYRDGDADGIGAGEPVECAEADAAAVSHLSPRNDDCDDKDPERSPSLSDVCGDGIDNDCDGAVDDESNNACGGPCGTQLSHQPGEVCSNGLLGACLRPGTYECRGGTSTVCNAPNATGSSELCGDSVDNDCDGLVNEADAVDATVWYEDCDGDGYSPLTDALIASGIGTRRACTKPTATESCLGGWTSRHPQAGSTWDCDDTSRAYTPTAAFGVPPEGKTRIDRNCDGVDEKLSSSPGSGFCPASWSCAACATAPDGSARYGTQWLIVSGEPTDIHPPCSASEDDLYPYRTTNSFLEGNCPNGAWGFVAGLPGYSLGMVQNCR